MSKSNYSQEELAEIGQDVITKRETQKVYDKRYNARIKWQNEQYKESALANGFELPEYPEELQ